MSNLLVAIVPAAGIGCRAISEHNNLPKQYVNISNIPILRHSVIKLLSDSRISHVNVIVTNHDNLAEKVLSGLDRTSIIKCGGANRINTVLNALNSIKIDDENWVLVHDAVRPGLPLYCLNKLIDICLDESVGGLLAIPIVDTIKKNDNYRVFRTIERKNLWLAQTPQIFKAGLLRNALSIAIRNNKKNITDECSAMEYIGYKPLIVKGDIRNLKITWPEDFELMEKII